MRCCHQILCYTFGKILIFYRFTCDQFATFSSFPAEMWMTHFATSRGHFFRIEVIEKRPRPTTSTTDARTGRTSVDNTRVRNRTVTMRAEPVPTTVTTDGHRNDEGRSNNTGRNTGRPSCWRQETNRWRRLPSQCRRSRWEPKLRRRQPSNGLFSLLLLGAEFVEQIFPLEQHGGVARLELTFSFCLPTDVFF